MSKSLDRLTLLQTFVRIADAGSISAAARDLGLSQPSVSRQLAELESRFNAQLMRRTTHDLSLTPVGAELLADARRLLDSWEALEEKHLETEDALRGQLKVVAPIALGQLYLANIAFQFQKQHPLLSLSWQLEDRNIRFAEVGCDCWIKIGSVPDESLTIEPLGRVERLMVAAPELLEAYRQPKSPSDLEIWPCVALEPFEGGRIPLSKSSGKTIVVSLSVRLVTNNIFALHRAVLAGLGIAVLPRWFIEEDLNHGRLIDLLPQWRAPKLPIHVASLSKSYQPRRLRSFLEILRTEIPNLPGVEPPVGINPS
ncbi:LysR family transcriptional regulator [Nodosilinea sp. PGN35]|uniref:LysR family transcriptional regulator n=1 Tax=Nodosilinea sp. PGN35 TaxID=3020489 RepID=UPI0023B284B1|nr:LysR family transcriptional regulator [Nodosilinea sp. TSF1-S3]MDF0369635.1 LysR family transcriptional regulator [Nodosilinea sp. TSF1-S3]